jgi:hypothetical protein
MTLELVKVQDYETASAFYCILVDGQMIPSGWSGDLEEATDLFNRIVADPSYINTRKQILQTATI